MFGYATATDNAGNAVTTASNPARIDLTPPIITFLGQDPPANIQSGTPPT